MKEAELTYCGPQHWGNLPQGLFAVAVEELSKIELTPEQLAFFNNDLKGGTTEAACRVERAIRRIFKVRQGPMRTIPINLCGRGYDVGIIIGTEMPADKRSLKDLIAEAYRRGYVCPSPGLGSDIAEAICKSLTGDEADEYRIERVVVMHIPIYDENDDDGPDTELYYHAPCQNFLDINDDLTEPLKLRVYQCLPVADRVRDNIGYAFIVS